MMERKTIFDPKIMAILGGWVEPATPEELCTMYESAARAYATRLDEVEPRLEELEKELAAAKALLARVFGRSCDDCACESEIGVWCDLVDSDLEYEGGCRDKRCPYLPWEEKE